MSSSTSPNTQHQLLLSEGTCYFGAGQKADPNFIPCGNANLDGPQACCYKGDYCLAGNACWDATTVVTYIAGCTDPHFRAAQCPQRNNYPDQQWVALARCNGAEKKYWTGCAYHPKLIEIEKENCECNRTNTLLENPDGNIATLLEIGLLPNKTGDRIEFNPTAIPSLSPTDNSKGGLSTGAKAGIGVGVAIAVLLLVAVGGFMLLRRRRNAKANANDAEMDQSRAIHEKLGSDSSSSTSGDLQRGASVNTAGQQSELSSDAAVMEMPSPDEKMKELPSPPVEPSELDNTNQRNSIIHTPNDYYSRESRFHENPSSRDVSPEANDGPAFVSPFNNETVQAPRDASRDRKKSQLKGSRVYSVASPAAERDAVRTDFSGSIPTAGGFEIGERSRASRREKRKRQSQNNRASRDMDIQEM